MLWTTILRRARQEAAMSSGALRLSGSSLFARWSGSCRGEDRANGAVMSAHTLIVR